MATTWVLDTQTKGTGATMVPLERVLAKPGAAVPGFPLPKLKPVPEDSRERQPHAFKVLDVVSRQAIAEDVDARGAVEALAGVRSIIDVNVYVRDPDTREWRLLSLAETRALWNHRDHGRADPPAS